MALDADEIVVGADGALYVAEVGTTGPTDIDTTLGAGWAHLGYTNEDGVEITPGMDMSEINGWQSFYALRRIVTSRSLEIGVTLLQWNADTIKLAFGGGEVTTAAGVSTYSPPEPSVIDYRALVVEWADGDKGYRLHIPKALVTDTGGMSLNRSDASGINLTFALEATDGTDPFTLITDDPAFA
jgi:hypothetical protein